MARITVAKIDNCVKLLTKKLTEKQIKKNDELQALMYKIYKENLPPGLYEVYEKHPNYFNASSSIILSGNGFNWQRINIGLSLPISKNNFCPNVEEVKALSKTQKELDLVDIQLQQAKQDLNTLLRQLSTDKIILEHFPELHEILSEKKSMLQKVIQVKELKEILNS